MLSDYRHIDVIFTIVHLVLILDVSVSLILLYIHFFVLYTCIKLGGNIPHSIKVRVLEEWINGKSRDVIASQNEIGTGTVSKIAKEASTAIADMDTLRALSRYLKKHDVTVDHFIPAVRLSNRLINIGITVEEMDSIMEILEVHCFKREKTVKELLYELEELTAVAYDLNVSPFGLSDYINKQLDKKNGLDSQIHGLESRLSNALNYFDISMNDLETYQKNRNLIDEINRVKSLLKEKEKAFEELKNKIQNERNFSDSMDASSNSTIKKEINKYNLRFKDEKPLGFNELQCLLCEIQYNPNQYPEIVQYMREKIDVPDDLD